MTGKSKKVKVTPKVKLSMHLISYKHNTMRAYRGVVSFMFRSLYPVGKGFSYTPDRRLSGLVLTLRCR
jgi:hypothetical protein